MKPKRIGQRQLRFATPREAAGRRLLGGLGGAGGATRQGPAGHGTARHGDESYPARKLRDKLKVAVLLRLAADLLHYISNDGNAPMADAVPRFIRDRHESAS